MDLPPHPPTPPPPKKNKSLLQNRQLQKIGEFSSRKKVPPYLLKGRRARLIHVYYHPNNHKKYCLLYTFITSDQDVALIKRASEVFSIVMKTHNCLRRTYVSSPRLDAHGFQSRAQRVPPPLENAHKKARAYHPVFKLKAWKVTVVWTDATMPPFNVISIRSTPEIVLSSYKKTKNNKKEKMKGGLGWMTNYRE